MWAWGHFPPQGRHRIHCFSRISPNFPRSVSSLSNLPVILTPFMKLIHPPEAVASEAAAHGSDLTLEGSGAMRK